MTEVPPHAGWYPHPSVPNTQKYWDGKTWTAQTRKKPKSKSGRGATQQAPRSQGARGAASDKQGFLASLVPDPDVLAAGLVDNTTTMKIYRTGSFSLKSVWGRQSAPEQLLGFDHDIDSMRRKSLTGRGAAAVLTGGASLLASNNRGVVYVTVTGAQTNVRTFTTRNPNGTTLASIRALKAAADVLLARDSPVSASAGSSDDVAAQLKQLADLHASGALSHAEFAAAKARLLG